LTSSSGEVPLQCEIYYIYILYYHIMHSEFTYTRKRAANHYFHTYEYEQLLLLLLLLLLYYTIIYMPSAYIVCFSAKDLSLNFFFTILFLPLRVVNNALAYIYIICMYYAVFSAKRFMIAPIVYQCFFIF